jgi:hypothetical protein
VLGGHQNSCDTHAGFETGSQPEKLEIIISCENDQLEGIGKKELNNILRTGWRRF